MQSCCTKLGGFYAQRSNFGVTIFTNWPHGDGDSPQCVVMFFSAFNFFIYYKDKNGSEIKFLVDWDFLLKIKNINFFKTQMPLLLLICIKEKWLTPITKIQFLRFDFHTFLCTESARNALEEYSRKNMALFEKKNWTKKSSQVEIHCVWVMYIHLIAFFNAHV